MTGPPHRTHRSITPHRGMSSSARCLSEVASAGRKEKRRSATVNGFTEALRQEVTKTRVRVGVLEPGAVATEVVFAQQRASPSRRAATPTHRRAAGCDIADGITYMVTRPRRSSGRPCTGDRRGRNAWVEAVGVRCGRRASAAPVMPGRSAASRRSARLGRGADRRGRGRSAPWRVAGCRASIRRARARRFGPPRRRSARGAPRCRR
jgi:hypothetical protein